MAKPKTSQSLTEKAKAAQQKPASIGENINIDKYTAEAEELPYQEDPSEISAEDKRRMLGTGVILDSPELRSGTYIQMDNTAIHSSVQQDDIEVMAVSQALQKHDWLPDYFWKAVAIDTDKYTANVELGQYDGYFIRALPGAKSIQPVQSCLYLTQAQLAQRVHNIIIAEENSELHIITGCATAHNEPGLHLGVSEFYIKKGAKVTFTMIHTWNPETAVRPRTACIIEEGGLFMSNYLVMKPARTIQTNPTAKCVGEGATVRFNSILLASAGTTLDVGSKVILDAPKTRTEIISRAISNGGDIIARGYIEGNAPEAKGHLECRGLILGKKGTIHAIPELKGNLAGVDLSHEAAVGKIAEEEVEYMMARGLTRSEATAAIVHGFLRVDIDGLPPMLNSELQKAIAESEKDIM